MKPWYPQPESSVSSPEIQAGSLTTHNSRFPDLNATWCITPSITILILEHFVDDHREHLYNLLTYPNIHETRLR